jgi:hypothetical protein
MTPQNTKWILMQDIQTFLLAIIIIVGYVIFYGIILIKNTGDFEGLKNITATFGTIVAGVIGYYFGNRQVQNYVSVNENLRSEFRKETLADVSHIQDDIDSYKSGIDELKKIPDASHIQEIDSYRIFIDELKKKLKED